jgi:hypothetical protein
MKGNNRVDLPRTIAVEHCHSAAVAETKHSHRFAFHKRLLAQIVCGNVHVFEHVKISMVRTRGAHLGDCSRRIWQNMKDIWCEATNPA